MSKPPFEDCTLFRTTDNGQTRIWISKESATDLATFKEIMKQLDIDLDKENEKWKNCSSKY
jgi:hypothetical protein